MQQRTLEQWLAWMEANHPREIDLGLERIAAVAANLQLDLGGAQVVTVGGTNGKGSTVAFIETILRAQGYTVGAYTSPHMLRYNERVRINGVAVTDAALCDAFAAVAQGMRDISLTYFEFGTLAALWLFAQSALDVVVLEVGIGGRLDAVNLIDADVAVLATIDLDHMDWLGPDRESIGREKAGIFRAGKPAICIDEQPPRSVIDGAAAIGAHWYALGAAFHCAVQGDGWSWSGQHLPRPAHYTALPLPALPLPSAAAALAAIHCLPLTVGEKAIRAGLRDARVTGRFERVRRDGVELILDIAHNPQASRWLAQRLAELPHEPTYAVFAIMADKDFDAVIEAVRERIDHWFIGDLAGNARALAAVELEKQLRSLHIEASTRLPTVAAAYEQALLRARERGGRVVVFGSTFTVAAVLAQWQC